MAQRDPVYRITNANVGLSHDQSARTRKYLVSMAIRTVCFLGAVVTQGWMRWALVVGAVILPYLAVVVANAGRERTKDQDLTIIVPDTSRALPPPGVIHTDEPWDGPRA